MNAIFTRAGFVFLGLLLLLAQVSLSAPLAAPAALKAGQQLSLRVGGNDQPARGCLSGADTSRQVKRFATVSESNCVAVAEDRAD